MKETIIITIKTAEYLTNRVITDYMCRMESDLHNKNRMFNKYSRGCRANVAEMFQHVLHCIIMKLINKLHKEKKQINQDQIPQWLPKNLHRVFE